MKKEEIYVNIKGEAEHKRAVEILKNAGERIGDMGWSGFYCILEFSSNRWDIIGNEDLTKTEITIDQLYNLLIPSIDKEIESFKNRMKERGFEVSVVIEKEIFKPDDIVMYWDNCDNRRMFRKYHSMIESEWDNVVKVTDENIIKFLGL